MKKIQYNRDFANKCLFRKLVSFRWPWEDQNDQTKMSFWRRLHLSQYDLKRNNFDTSATILPANTIKYEKFKARTMRRAETEFTYILPVDVLS